MFQKYASNSVLAKSRSKYGRRLTRKNYRDLISLPGVSEVAAYIKNNTHYAGALQSVQESAMHRGNLERMLRTQIYEDLFRICYFERSIGEGFFLYFVVSWETEELVSLLSFLAAGNPEEYLLTMSTVVNKFSPVDLSNLSTAKSFAEVLEKLDGTPYANLLKGFLPESGKDSDLYLPAIEAALQKFRYKYCKNVFKNQFSGRVYDELLSLLNMMFELSDCATIIRCKTFKGWTPDLIRAHLVGEKALLPAGMLTAMIEATSGEETLKIFMNSPYKKYFSHIELRDDIFIDELVLRILYYEAGKRMHFSIDAPVVMLSMNICFMVELENITNIIEAVRYGVSADYTEKLMILEKGGDPDGH